MSVSFGGVDSGAGLGDTDVPAELSGVEVAEGELAGDPGRAPANPGDGV